MAFKPLDLMQAYRLEMGKLPIGEQNLYEFWKSTTKALNKRIREG
jgi:cytoplasmic iron level regulating protein YaaA (DUF328/UPF0246 family)